MNEDFIPCEYEISQKYSERGITIRCKECENDFDIGSCISNIVMSMKGEYNIDSIILSDYIEKQYSRKSLKLLKKLRDLLEVFERFSSRKKEGKECADCPIAPDTMYSELKITMFNGDDVYQRYLDYTMDIMRLEGCVECRRSAKEEFSFIGDRLLDLNSSVLMDAYGILG